MHKHAVRRRRRAQINGAKDAVEKISGGGYEDFVLDDGNGKFCPPNGCVSVCGRRKEMEDATAVVPTFIEFCGGGSGAPLVAPLHFFAVYDGHGGARAALLCRERLHGLLASELSGVAATGEFDEVVWRRAAAASFARMDAEICKEDDDNSNNEGETGGGREVTGGTGTTAVVVVIGRKDIAVANCGDSRAVLSRGRGRTVPLTLDHKPERADETARIEAAGGHVIFWNGYRVLGVLATSRSIGDRYLKPYVVADPEVTFINRCPDDEFLILASDGLWDVVTNDAACEVARRCLAGRLRNSNGLSPVEEQTPSVMAAALLTKLAIARGSSDNISVVVVDLSHNL